MSDKQNTILIPSEYARLLDDDWREALVEGGRYCFRGDTLVTTNKGYNRIDSLKVGDKVLSRVGVYDTIIDITKYDKNFDPKPMIEVVINGVSTHATYDHKYWNGKAYVPLYKLVWGIMDTSQRRELELLCKQYGTDTHDEIQGWLSNQSDEASSQSEWVFSDCNQREIKDSSSDNRKYIHRQSREQRNGESYQWNQDRQSRRESGVGNKVGELNACKTDRAIQGFVSKGGEKLQEDDRASSSGDSAVQIRTFYNANKNDVTLSRKENWSEIRWDTRFVKWTNMEASTERVSLQKNDKPRSENLYVSVARVYQSIDVWSISVSGGHNYFANGINVSNSLKSHTVARVLIIKSMNAKKRVLCGREFQNSIADSVHQLFVDIINQYKISGWSITRDSIIYTPTGSDFLFKGVRHNMQSIKSLEGVDIFWGEESQTFSKESIDVITPTIRKPGSQLIWTMNRLLELDPIYVRFDDELPNAIHIKANYDIAEKYGWLPTEIKDEIEHDKKNDPGLYAYKWLGEPMSQVDDAILSRDKVLAAMTREIEAEGAIEIGVDVARMGNDRTEFVMRKGLKEVGRETYQKLRTTEVCDRLEIFADHDKTILIKVDDTGVGCITHDTSILTPDGWKYPTELVGGDIVYTKDDNGSVTTTTVFSVNERETDIIESGGYKFAWAHQLPTKTRNNNAFKMRTWQQALENKTAIFDTVFNYSEEQSDFIMPVQSIEMPNGGKKIINDEIYIDGEEFAKLLGWYVSEGSLDKSSGCIKITQVKTQHFDEIERVMSYFGKVIRKKNDFVVFNKSLYKWLSRYCYKGGSGFKYKTVPRWVTNNSVNVIQAFLEAFRDGDGYIHHGRNYYVTSSVNLPNDLIELIYKTGKSAGVYKKYDAGSTFEIEGRTATRTEDNYVVFEYARNNYGISGKETSTYAGKVYSIILNNDTKMMFTKVDGQKPFWTHNGGVTDEMIRRGYKVIPINFGASAGDKDKYPNLISEAWFHVASIIDDISLLHDSDLLMELSSRKWVMDSKGRRGVEGKDAYKKRGYRSPDKADATILAYYTPNTPTIEILW